MLPESKLLQLKSLAGALSNDELVWTQGFLAGVLSTREKPQPAPTGPEREVTLRKIAILYGTETGNSKSLGLKFAQKIKSTGQSCKLASLDQYRADDLSKEENVIFIVSTHGEGEPPASARKFFQYVNSKKEKLTQLSYAVLALGDSAYPQFCQAGIELDDRLSKLGATRIQDVLKCDVDFETDSFDWFEGVWANLKSTQEKPTPALNTISHKKTGRTFYKGKVRTAINLNGTGSSKETYHIEIECSEPVDYQPGDSLGIIPENRRDIVHQILKITGANPQEELTAGKFSGTIQNLLVQHLNICHLSTTNLKNIASITGHSIPDIRMDLIDILRIHPVKNPNQFAEIVKILSPIAPRLYSISSAPAAHDREVHITVSQNSFRIQDEIKFGLCSQFIGTMEEGEEVEFYIHKNNLFKLPPPDKDLIMVGPGSGIAAMRSFLYQRESTGATGRNWLFFGDQHFTTDFLYQTEIQNWLETGVLTKLSVAFSRDQENKFYVQHKMAAVKKELCAWIEKGASLYISGTREPMSVDVEDALLKIFESQGRSEAEAKQYLEGLKDENRYLLDVY